MKTEAQIMDWMKKLLDAYKLKDTPAELKPCIVHTVIILAKVLEDDDG